MRSQRALSELVGLIYDAAGNPARWPTFLQGLGRELKSTGNNIFVQDLRSQEFSVAANMYFCAFFVLAINKKKSHIAFSYARLTQVRGRKHSRESYSCLVNTKFVHFKTAKSM